MTIERRILTLDKLEARAAAGDQPALIMGHAAVFGTPTQIGSYFREQIKPGAFADAIKNDDVRALFNHNPDYVLGRNTAGTLRLSEDDVGLAIEVDPPDTQFARDLMVSIGRRDISQMSFGFRCLEETWSEDESGAVMRTLNKVQLFDVSPVTYPAYTDTDVAVRSFEAYRKAHPTAVHNTVAAVAEGYRRRIALALAELD